MSLRLKPEDEQDDLSTVAAELINSDVGVTMEPKDGALRIFLENISLVLFKGGRWRIE